MEISDTEGIRMILNINESIQGMVFKPSGIFTNSLLKTLDTTHLIRDITNDELLLFKNKTVQKIDKEELGLLTTSTKSNLSDVANKQSFSEDDLNKLFKFTEFPESGTGMNLEIDNHNHNNNDNNNNNAGDDDYRAIQRIVQRLDKLDELELSLVEKERVIMRNKIDVAVSLITEIRALQKVVDTDKLLLEDFNKAIVSDDNNVNTNIKGMSSRIEQEEQEIAALQTEIDNFEMLKS